MVPKPLTFTDLLARLEFEQSDEAFDAFRGQAIEYVAQGRLLDAVRLAQFALHDGAARHDRTVQAYVFAYLAAVYAVQENFNAAAQNATDCYRLFNLLGNRHNTAVARALLAAVYQAHLDNLSTELTETLHVSQAETKALEGAALSKGSLQADRAERYRQQFIEHGELARRARWIRAIPHALPLVWLPVIESMPGDPDTQGAEPVGYLEPVLFVLKTRQEADREDAGASDPGQVDDQLYTARPLPALVDDDESAGYRPPRLKPNALYAAIKVDSDMAMAAGLRPDDYLLVRSLSSADRAEMLRQADENLTGFYFQVNAEGAVEVVKAIPPKFVGEDEIKMLVAQVDAILRRVP